MPEYIYLFVVCLFLVCRLSFLFLSSVLFLRFDLDSAAARQQAACHVKKQSRACHCREFACFKVCHAFISSSFLMSCVTFSFELFITASLLSFHDVLPSFFSFLFLPFLPSLQQGPLLALLRFPSSSCQPHMPPPPEASLLHYQAPSCL